MEMGSFPNLRSIIACVYPAIHHIKRHGIGDNLPQPPSLQQAPTMTVDSLTIPVARFSTSSCFCDVSSGPPPLPSSPPPVLTRAPLLGSPVLGCQPGVLFHTGFVPYLHARDFPRYSILQWIFPPFKRNSQQENFLMSFPIKTFDSIAAFSSPNECQVF